MVACFASSAPLACLVPAASCLHLVGCPACALVCLSRHSACRVSDSGVYEEGLTRQSGCGVGGRGMAGRAGAQAALACLNSQISAATGSLSWMTTEWLIRKRPSVLGIISGALAVKLVSPLARLSPTPSCSSLLFLLALSISFSLGLGCGCVWQRAETCLSVHTHMYLCAWPLGLKCVASWPLVH